ncbi:hypothetical protein [uncultured Brevibacillus sp.]|uniref:hypothetical protein n=1 Tax=uncultured Brevibacillus sp. TaxID=169970 RepID=UPI002598FFF6|nr:hypothetical protein [uncultured Brevibacillus sp.]
MEPIDRVWTWITWHHAVEYVKQDLPQVESMDIRFPFFPGWILRQIGSKAYAKEQETTKELKANGIRIVKEKFDKGELFVIWAHRGSTDIFRISEGKLRSKVQEKINEITKQMMEENKDAPPSKKIGDELGTN